MTRNVKYSSLLVCTSVAVLSTLLICSGTWGQDNAVTEYSSLVNVSKGSLTIKFVPPSGKSGTLEAELYDLGGAMLAKVTQKHQGKPLEITFIAEINTEDMANYYLRFRFDSGEYFRKRSLFYLGEILETTILGQCEFIAGTRPVIRILVRDRASGNVIEGAQVAVELSHEQQILSKFTARSDGNGEVAAPLDIPDKVVNNAVLKVVVTSQTARDSVEETIRIRSALKTLLTTDKPLYQPGQTIHIRALTLSQSDMKPLTDGRIVFEVEDSKGNKVFKSYKETDRFGVSHTDFVLADELNMGAYKIRAIAAGMVEEKTVTVERYVLPKFKVNVTTDRNFYQPGETVKGEIQVDYFFGKPVANGKVEIKCSKFDVAYVDFQVIEGTTNEQGHYIFEARLPDHFVGQPLEAGRASAKLEIKVIDTADHKETITRNIPVTASPIIIAAVPESGELVPGLDNKVYIVTAYADSTPAACKVTCTVNGKTQAVESDEAGFGEITITPEDPKALVLAVSAKDTKGQTGRAEIELKARAPLDEDTILLRTDKSLYNVGDKIELSVMTTRKTGSVYMDFIKDRQTCLTRTLNLMEGKASGELVWDVSFAGTVQINAYLIGKNGQIIRDQRLVLVDPADDLSIAISSDSETYLPGTDAALSFKVTDKKGRPVASALGVMVVDEAVFALQEMQPGLEKVYFYLEKEIATPRYEIHGYDLNTCIGPSPLPEPRPLDVRRDTAAKVLLASAKGVGEYPLHVNTWQKDNKAQAFQAKMALQLQPRYDNIRKALDRYSQKHREDKKKIEKGITLSDLVQQKYLKQGDILDPWDNEMKLSGTWCQGCQTYHGFVLTSAGIDGIWATADDISSPDIQPPMGAIAGRRNAVFDELKFGVMKAAAMPMVMTEIAGEPESVSHQVAGPEPIRIREYFPETLYFNPAVITDGQGRAILNIPLADSITTWRLTCMASSAAGQLGSTTDGIRVFQDFFVDIDFPVFLTQNDKIHVPIALYNYLKSDQTIKLQVKQEDWFELEGLPEKTVTLAPSEVRAVYFPMTVRKIGFQKFTVTAYGSKKSDAVARSVEIVPDGKEHLVSQSGRLKANIEHIITIPEGAIDDAGKIFVKIYPGVLSQVVEGLDKMLQMPFGCFEQTSSVTYPNILVLDYMKTTKKITPELQMKAEGFINAGYQRLVSFEVDGGGFEWFGKAPAHRILTAYGLMEFYDMSKVYEVDPAVIARTQQWLAKCQENDGSWKPSQEGIREGAINKFTDDVLRNTAYITWALASTKYEGPQVKKGVDYLRNHLDAMKDAYTRALVVNALSVIAPDDKTTLETLEALHKLRTEEGDTVYWKADSETTTYGTGKAADIELTALAAQAFIRCGRELETVSKAITYLVKNKDAMGTWQSTQATIQALRAMLMAERGATARANAGIAVLVEDQKISEIKIDEKNSDVLHLVDLKDHTHKGDNRISIAFEGKGELLYQIVGRYFLPYPKNIAPEKEMMSIDVRYDRTQLAARDIINVTAEVRNNRPGKAKMVIVDLGLPPGFTLIPDKLNKLVEEETIEKYTTTGRQIIIYLREVENRVPVQIHYQLMAKYPLTAKSPKSTVYEYYNPDIRSESEPIQLVVSKSKE